MADLDEPGPWHIELLVPLVERLELLAARHNDQRLLLAVISDRERTRVGRMEPLRPVISRLAGRISEARSVAEGPTFVGKMLLGASGDLLCLVSVKGEIKLIGVKNNDGLNLKGTGRLEGEIGWCPFCISFGRTVGMTYKNNSWDVDF